MCGDNVEVKAYFQSGISSNPDGCT